VGANRIPTVAGTGQSGDAGSIGSTAFENAAPAKRSRGFWQIAEDDQLAQAASRCRGGREGIRD
jgi:hypothetical protein